MATTTDKKMSKGEAKYQWRPNGEEMCKLCTMYRRPAKCTAVQGDISPRGWCKLYEEIKV